MANYFIDLVDKGNGKILMVISFPAKIRL